MTEAEHSTRALSFGANAERYDRARPSYAPELIDELAAGQPGAVLDVGCGTGILSRQLRERGCTVLGVEPDPQMAAVARRHGLTVEDGRFEDWDPAGRQFDLVVSGQAWHWVDPEAGRRQAARVLVPGGLLALMWNQLAHTPEVRAVMQAAYRAHAPELLEHNMALGTAQLLPGHVAGADDPIVASLSGTAEFEPPDLREYPWERRYTPARWLDELPTHSNHALLPPPVLAAILADIGAGLAGMTEFTATYRTLAILARRAA